MNNTRSGTIWNHLERPPASWNARSAIGTEPRLYLEPREALWNGLGQWNARKALAALVLFVGRRYYLRPIILWNARSAPGTRLGAWNRAAGSTWNARRAIGTARSGIGPAAGLSACYTAFTGLRSAAARWRVSPQSASREAMASLVNCSLSKCPTSMMPIRPAFSMN